MNRSTRRISITEAGQAYCDRCQHVLMEIDEMESAVGDSTAIARGTLKINAPMSFGVSHLARAVADYQREQLGVRVDLTLDDCVVDVVSEGFDLAIRIGRLAESSLVVRKLAPIRLVVCGSPSYLSAHGTPGSPDDLSTHKCLRHTFFSGDDHWLFERGGKSYNIQVDGEFSANNADAVCEAAMSGAGLILQPTFIVGRNVRDG